MFFSAKHLLRRRLQIFLLLPKFCENLKQKIMELKLNGKWTLSGGDDPDCYLKEVGKNWF